MAQLTLPDPPFPISAASNQYSFTSNSSTANSTLLASLTHHTSLDKFSKMLSFLSSADRLSGAVDCIRAIEEISGTLFKVWEATQTFGDSDINKTIYGIPTLNPDESLGLVIDYWREHNAAFNTGSVIPAEIDEQFCIYSMRWGIRENKARSSPGVIYRQNWIKSDSVVLVNGLVDEWQTSISEDDTALSKTDPSAEFILLLEPPVCILTKDAEILKATSSGGSVASEFSANQMYTQSQFHLEHPSGRTIKIDVSFANFMPINYISVSEIPISHPRELPRIIQILRRSIKLMTALESVLKSNSLKVSTNSNENDNDDEVIDTELMLVDAMLNQEHQQPILDESSSSFVMNLSLSLNSMDQVNIQVSIPMLRSILFDLTCEVVEGLPLFEVQTLKISTPTVQNGNSKYLELQDRIQNSLNTTEDFGIMCIYIEQYISQLA